MARRRLQFEPGVAGVEATQPKRLGDGMEGQYGKAAASYLSHF